VTIEFLKALVELSESPDNTHENANATGQKLKALCEEHGVPAKTGIETWNTLTGMKIRAIQKWRNMELL
jgi:hypothetical protein